MTNSDLPTKNREIHLASRPEGWPTPENFDLVEVDLPELGDGQVLVKNHYMSVDPYMRGRMNDVKSYVPPFQIGEALDGGAIGEVVASTSADVPVGATVLHGLGWREYAVLDAAEARVVDAGEIGESTYLGALGMTGLTAYAGLVYAGGFEEGDVVFVSGAAGAVGSMVGQIAKAMGASRVIGSAGSAEKIARIEELGFDAGFDYHDGPVVDRLREAAPDGIDVYFDNVGGDHLEAAIDVLNPEGRVTLCGAIAQYNETEPPCAPRNLALAIGKRLRLQGFLVGPYFDKMGEYAEKMSAWLADGSVQFDETVREGLENAPQAFIDLLRGANTGKMVVKL
ncbi:NADP-dependent oxidoreductase [Mobilicoccus pelagius]|uniref:Putative NADP-dependent oxidoreductase n=1 Tax=Mobilicoccus pelagius NBRC 104925 TaxID=1089455 RepID=H5UU70_9MICO|nr:NADP-dependent oxidoreductase [Mobilicoccus pelagius]GAB49278.1 putative NADP-dependent oxidoreductase [Mobilicoccus pelagius NBRC 104925]